MGLADRIAQGRGEVAADLVLKGGRVFDLITGELVETDVAICGETIVGVYETYAGTREIDCRGRILVPGFIDTHLHIESSLVTPFEFDRCVCPRGVTTAICDPHEIANVCGAGGDRLFPRRLIPHGDGYPGEPVVLRAVHAYGDDRGAAGGGGSGAADGSSPGDRAGGVHELSGRDLPRSGLHGQA